MKNVTMTSKSIPSKGVLKRRMRLFARDEDGSLIIFGIFIFGLMLAIGGLSFDLMRYESQRSILQNTTDRAALAAASLTQSLEPNAVVQDYFAKAGMSDYLDSITVTEGVGSRRVDVNASLNVPLHHGNFGVFGGPENQNDTLLVQAKSTAMEAIGNVEISMVLDVSGSMGRYSRLINLKTASENFIDTIYDAAEPGTISTSVVPYAEQVTAGQLLLSHYTMDESAHNRSFCVNFAEDDYNSTALSTTAPLQQTLHFDPWTDDNYWNVNNSDNNGTLRSLVCRTQASREIMAWEENPATLKAHINSFYSGGNTSTDVGLKWGVALLDPGTQGVLNSMIASGDVDSDFASRPEEYEEQMTMKIIVVMSDGENTRQHYMDEPYRTGDTAIYRYLDPDDNMIKYSIWTGPGDPDIDPTPACKAAGFDNCKTWNQRDKDWYLVNDDQTSDTPYGGANATRMTWGEFWAEVPVDEMTDEFLPNMGGQSADISGINAAAEDHSGSVKNTRMAAICSAAKAQGITIFSVALDTNDAAAGRLQSCASSPAHFYRVTGAEINFAFQAIASQINMLRLVH